MGFAGIPPRTTLSKLEYAQYFSTALSHLVAQGQDQVGLAVIADRPIAALPPGGTPSHVVRVHRQIESIRLRPTKRFAPGLRELFRRSPRRGALLVASDFLQDDLEESFAALRLFQHRSWELVALHLVHPDEERLPEGRAFRFEDLEDKRRISCSPRQIADEYRRRFENHCAMVRSLALAMGCDYRRVSTAVPYLQTLGGFLIERSG